jgi:hypothetical protein
MKEPGSFSKYSSSLKSESGFLQNFEIFSNYLYYVLFSRIARDNWEEDYNPYDLEIVDLTFHEQLISCFLIWILCHQNVILLSKSEIVSNLFEII